MCWYITNMFWSIRLDIITTLIVNKKRFDSMNIDSDDIACIEETAITVRSYRRRTTVPSKIYKLMNLTPEDSLRWIGMKDGSVIIIKVPMKENLLE